VRQGKIHDHEISYIGSLSNININIDTRELIQDDEDPSRPNGASNIFNNLIQVRKKDHCATGKDSSSFVSAIMSMSTMFQDI
jgi:hypothetical protein